MDKKDRSQDIQILSRNILWLRRYHGISQKQMAVLLKIGTGSLRKLEAGILPPRLGVNIFFDIYRHFGIPPKVLLGTLLEEQHNSPRL